MKIRFAYQAQPLHHLWLLKECKGWFKDGWLEATQLQAIEAAYPSPLYHPNLMIRLLLWVATLFALSGVTGILALLFGSWHEDFLFLGCIAYAAASIGVAEKFFIARQHYKSGVNEALIYHSCGFAIVGAAGFFDFNAHVLGAVAFVIFTAAAIRYLDVVCTACAILALGGWLFYELYTLSALRPFIPLVFLVTFALISWLSRRWKKREACGAWHTQLVVIDSASLLVCYAAGNYLVVRMLSEELMDLYLEPGQDIPLAWFFYGSTVVMPLLYLFVGLRQKDVVLLRVSLLAIAFSVFTFKYYFSLGHPEITLTAAGLALMLITLGLLQYLKTMRHGYTREPLRSSRWAALQAEAFVISQTLGGTSVSGKNFGGGATGGGGAQSSF
jgi:hypothetical protein